MERDDTARENARRTPSPRELARFTFDFGEWTKAHGLVLDASGAARGSIAGVSVQIRSGLGGSRPSAVEIVMALAHDDVGSRLVTRGSDESMPLGRALRDALDGPGLASVRTIAIVPEGLRVRLEALSPPEDFEVIIEGLARAVRAARPAHAAYR
jgi:hypothetical protein